jgi:hypothetical protein
VVGFNLGHGVNPLGRPVAGQLSGTVMRAWLTRLMLCVPVCKTVRLADVRLPYSVARSTPINQGVRVEKGLLHCMTEQVSTSCIQCTPYPLGDFLQRACVSPE